MAAGLPRDAAKIILERDIYQKELPLPVNHSKPPPKDSSDDEPVESSPPIERLPRELPTLPLEMEGQNSLSATRWVLWGLFAIAALFILITIIRDIRSRPGRVNRDNPVVHENSRPTPPTTKPTKSRSSALDEIDRLADNGNFSGAVHLLLALSMERVRAQFSPTSFVSMTNREILRAAKLSGKARSSFSTIINAEELSHFGGRQTNLNIFQICRDNYLAFEQSMEGAHVGK
jgi:hypothetical protein